MDREDDFKPFIPADRSVPEITATSVVLGILLAVLFGGANAYLGLRVGMTVSASIPAAVVSMGIIRIIMRKDSVLENNMVQTIGSAGESLAAGAIFTMPALFMWAAEGGAPNPSLLEISLISVCGGILGVLFMVPLRTSLIVKERNVLPYPEGKACAEVLLAGETGGSKAGTVFCGLGIAAAYKFVADGLKLFPSSVVYSFKRLKGAGIGIDVLPALTGVGYICGAKVSSYLLAGGVTGWFVIMPLIALFGAGTVLYPADIPISQMGTGELWGSYIRYIGAGAVAAGGVISLIKSVPTIISTFARAFKGIGKNDSLGGRTSHDLPIGFVLIGIVIIAAALWLLPAIPVNLAGTVFIIVFGFFFATVSSRMVGLVGSSNNPVSGMSIATLLLATIVLKASGNTGMSGMIAAIVIGSVICIIAAMAGDTSQDLKTGYIVGATPYKQQIGELIGAVASALAIGGILYLLNAAWGYGKAELPAPQAMLMKMVVEGVMGGTLPWTLVFIGVALAVVIEILRIPVLPFAVGLYLPIQLSTPIMAGGLIRLWVDNSRRNDKESVLENGILYSSGLIAGEGLMGILLAVCAVIPAGGGVFADMFDINAHTGFSIGEIGSLVVYAALVLSLILFTFRKKAGQKEL